MASRCRVRILGSETLRNTQAFSPLAAAGAGTDTVTFLSAGALGTTAGGLGAGVLEGVSLLPAAPIALVIGSALAAIGPTATATTPMSCSAPPFATPCPSAYIPTGSNAPLAVPGPIPSPYAPTSGFTSDQASNIYNELAQGLGLPPPSNLYTPPIAVLNSGSDPNGSLPNPLNLAEVSTPATPPNPSQSPSPAPTNQAPQPANNSGSTTTSYPTYTIGSSDGGPGQWTAANEGLSPAESAYQQQVTGAPAGTVYNVANSSAPSGITSFDGYAPATNTLLDAKLWNNWPISTSFSTTSVLEQAQAQIAAAGGANIEWVVPTEATASAIGQIFGAARISGIVVKVLPPTP